MIYGLTSLPKDGAFYSIMSPSIYWGVRTHTDCRVSTPTCIRTVCLLGETHIQTARPENILYTSMQTHVLLATQAQFHTSLSFEICQEAIHNTTRMHVIF